MLKNAKWNWSAECQDAFKEIKNKLTLDFSLRHFDPKLDIILAADFSDYVIGVVKFKDRKTKVIAHVLRTFISMEQSYSQIKNEALKIHLPWKNSITNKIPSKSYNWS